MDIHMSFYCNQTVIILFIINYMLAYSEVAASNAT